MEDIKRMLANKELPEETRKLIAAAYKAGISDMMSELKTHSVRMSTVKQIGMPAHTFMRAVGTNKIESVGNALISKIRL